MVDATAGQDAFKGTLSLSAWATICRAGAYHAPHCHPDSAWSGVCCVDAGTEHVDRPISGMLEFLDPRSGVEAVTAPGDPHGEPVRIRPAAGLLVIFPSWLYHWVHPYAGCTPRIARLVQRDAGGACPSHSRHRGRRRQQRDGRSHRDDVCHPALARPAPSKVEGCATKEPTDVLIRHAFRTLAAALTATTMTLAATSAYGQSQDAPRTLESDIAAMIADNAALREQLRKLEEQQKTLA